jgi:hypothetical protein
MKKPAAWSGGLVLLALLSTRLAGDPGTESASSALPPRKLQMLHELAQKSNKPIEFYGLVIDQDGNPIPGVKVTLSIRTTKEPMPGVLNDVFEQSVVNTDTQGQFALTGAKGALLSVTALEKDGYEASVKSLNRAHYWYWNDPRAVFHPNADKPEIFHLWKKAGAERLIRKGIGSGLHTEGTPTTFDLLNGTTTNAGGDLRVTLIRTAQFLAACCEDGCRPLLSGRSPFPRYLGACSEEGSFRNPQQIRWGQTHYEWTVTIEATDGGIIESNDEQMYRAPVDGYQPKVVVHMPADDQQWTDQKNVTLYLKLRGGKYYGRASLDFMVGADRQITPFGVTSFVNPSGSRNLEYDPLQDVIPSARSQRNANAPKP